MPAIIDHKEICPTGDCNGALMQINPWETTWTCSCGATFSSDQLYFLGGDICPDMPERDSMDWEQDTEEWI